MFGWKSSLEFQLRDETFKEEDDDELNVNDKAILAIHFDKEPLSFGKIISDEEKVNWSSWPSNLPYSFKNNMKREKVKTKLSIVAF